MSLRREAYIGVQLRGELLEVKLGCRKQPLCNFYSKSSSSHHCSLKGYRHSHGIIASVKIDLQSLSKASYFQFKHRVGLAP
jgi:hypothetical protein